MWIVSKVSSCDMYYATISTVSNSNNTGNEAEYVLVSVVRTNSPGFLKSLNRVNVMLTRCKAGMVIVTKKAFMRRKDVKKTLLGKLVAHWENLMKNLVDQDAWKDWKLVAERRCNLPGAIGHRTPRRLNDTIARAESFKMAAKVGR